jgi:hypothetical protein
MPGKDSIDVVQTSLIPTSTPRTDHFVAAQSYNANTNAERVLSGPCGHEHLDVDEAKECAVAGGMKVVVHHRYDVRPSRADVLGDRGRAEPWDAGADAATRGNLKNRGDRARDE